MSEYEKKCFSRSITSFKAPQWILGSKMMLNGEKVISKMIRIFRFSKKFKIFPDFFGKDLPCFLSKNLKIAKKKNLIFKFWGSKIEKKKGFFLNCGFWFYGANFVPKSTLVP